MEILPDIWGGTESFIYRLSQEIRRRDLQPLIVAHAKGKAMSRFIEAGFETSIFPYKGSASIEEIARWMSGLKLQLIQSNYFCLTLALAANRLGMPHLWRIGGRIEVVSPELKANERRAILSSVALLSKEVVCPSHYLASQFPRGLCHRVRVIPNGVTARQARGRIGRRGKGMYNVAMVAHFTSQKRHIDFLRAAVVLQSKFPKGRFFLVGLPYPTDKSRRYFASLQRMIRNLGLAESVELVSFDGESNDFIGSFDVLVLPAIREGIGNVLLEACAAGVPVVACRSGGISEVVQHGRTGWLVPAKAPEALAEAIGTLLKNSRKRREFGRNAYHLFIAKYQMETCAERFVDLFEKLTAPPKG